MDNLWINSILLIALPIAIVHLEPPSSVHLSTPDNRHPESHKGQQSVQNNLREVDTETASTIRRIRSFIIQVICPLLHFDVSVVQRFHCRAFQNFAQEGANA